MQFEPSQLILFKQILGRSLSKFPITPKKGGNCDRTVILEKVRALFCSLLVNHGAIQVYHLLSHFEERVQEV